MLKRRILKIVIAVATIASALGLASLGAAAVAATPRSAMPATAMTATSESPQLATSCTKLGAVVCIYANSNFSRGPGHFSGTNSFWGTFGSSHGACVAGATAAPDNDGGWNDCVSSIVNNTTHNFYFYVNEDCGNGGGPAPLIVANKSQLSNLSLNGHKVYNDALTSDKVGSAGGC